MPRGLELERKRGERGVVLSLLIEDDSEWTHVKTLRKMMDRRNYPVSPRGLEFHLKYLLGRGFVEVKRQREMEEILGEDELLAPDEILCVKVAPDGLQIVNGSLKDAEVVI